MMIRLVRDFGHGMATAELDRVGRLTESDSITIDLLRPGHEGEADAPRLRETVETVPHELGSGPDLDDFAQLEAGEISSLCIAGYRVDSWLDCGGMASIYVGSELDGGRPVAIKVLTRDCEDWEDALARFITEARLSFEIRHPNVVEVLDWGTTPGGVMYIVMELLRGEDLHATLDRRGWLPWPRVRALMLQLCAGLEAVHDEGVVHRDVKPANCFRVVDEDGGERLKLVDFGIATLTPAALAGQIHTIDGEVIGTPEYMSPEQVRGEKVDARADVYSAGVILCELLTGRPPVQGKTHQAVLTEQVYGQIAPLSQLAPPQVQIDPRLEPIYARALAKDPDQRYASIREFAAALAAVPVQGRAQVSGAFMELPLALALDDSQLPTKKFASDELEIAMIYPEDEEPKDEEPEGAEAKLGGLRRARSWLAKSWANR